MPDKLVAGEEERLPSLKSDGGREAKSFRRGVVSFSLEASNATLASCCILNTLSFS